MANNLPLFYQERFFLDLKDRKLCFMEREFTTESIIAEGTVYEGFTPHAQESPYWKYLRGEIIPQEILEKDPIYRLMRKTKGEEK